MDKNVNWKKLLVEILKRIGIIDEEFTGKIVINVGQGNIADVHKEERIK